METDDLAAQLADSATSFITDRYASRPLRLDIEQPQEVNRGIWQEMADLGWLGLALPEELEGLGMGLNEAATIAEIMGRAAVPEPFIAAALMPSILLKHCAASPIAKKVASAIAGGKRLVTIAWQEKTGEIEASNEATRFAANALTGAKCFVPVAEDDALILVSAKAAQGTVLVAVEANAKGVTIERQAGGAFAMANIKFNEAQVADSAPLALGHDADAALRCALQAGRVAAAAQLAGIGKGALDKTLTYVRERVQFERPIGSFQTVQHRSVDYYAQLLLAGASWRNAKQAFDADPCSAATSAAVSAAKARAADTAMQICRGAVQMHGAMGYTEEGGVGLYLRAAMQLASWLGNATAHRQRFVALTA